MSRGKMHNCCVSICCAAQYYPYRKVQQRLMIDEQIVQQGREREKLIMETYKKIMLRLSSMCTYFSHISQCSRRILYTRTHTRFHRMLTTFDCCLLLSYPLRRLYFPSNSAALYPHHPPSCWTSNWYEFRRKHHSKDDKQSHHSETISFCVASTLCVRGNCVRAFWLIGFVPHVVAFLFLSGCWSSQPIINGIYMELFILRSIHELTLLTFRSVWLDDAYARKTWKTS